MTERGARGMVEALDKVLDTRQREKDGRKPPFAMCRSCENEPLVMTFERTGLEFTCPRCDQWYTFLSPRPVEQTPELEARCQENKALYAEQRAAREAR